MKTRTNTPAMFAIAILWLFVGCGKDDGPVENPTQEKQFFFGSDLSYVNQVLDRGGVYKVDGEERDPYRIFQESGNNIVRLRLWHNPAWTKDIYGDEGTQLYNDLKDVEKAIKQSKENGMEVLLDFHYTDSWADPGKQPIPEAWQSIRDAEVLKDSVYAYTVNTLSYLNNRGLMPEWVQLGNEINCGMLFTEAPEGFPSCNACDGNWQRLGEVLNAAIKAVNDVSATSDIKPSIVLHVADPKNADWWFGNITTTGNVSGFDVIGLSYYPLWHTTISIGKLSEAIASLKSKYDKDVMILETAYPWTTEAKDSYNNYFGSETPLPGYPFTTEGQHDLLKMLTQEVKDGGGIGIIYWEPAWISIDMKDLWNTGSSWENNTFFDFEGNLHEGVNYMNASYEE